MKFQELLHNEIKDIINHPENQIIKKQSAIQQAHNLTLIELRNELRKLLYIKSFYENKLKNPDLLPDAKATTEAKLFELEQYKKVIQKKISMLIVGN